MIDRRVLSGPRAAAWAAGVALAALSASGYTLFCGDHSDARATVNVNPNCLDATAGTTDQQEAAIARALDTWSGGGSNFRFTFGGRTARATVAPTDGRHDVFWSNRSDGTAIAITYCDDGDVERGADVENLDGNLFTQGVGIGFDVESVDLHELGHVLGLGHTSEPAAAMRSAYEGVRRSLAADDVAGLRFLYGADSNPPDVRSVSPDFGPVRGGNPVEVRGLSFAPDATVTFDGVPVTVLSRSGSTVITVRAPAWTISGQVVDVRVSQATGSDSLRDAYTYVENVVALEVHGSPRRFQTVEVVVYGPPFQRAAVVAGVPGVTTRRGFTFCFDVSRSRVLGTFDTLEIPASGQTAPIPIRLDGPSFLTFHVQGVATTSLGLLQTNCVAVTILP
jgi:hypothetical protein